MAGGVYLDVLMMLMESMLRMQPQGLNSWHSGNAARFSPSTRRDVSSVRSSRGAATLLPGHLRVGLKDSTLSPLECIVKTMIVAVAQRCELVLHPCLDAS